MTKKAIIVGASGLIGSSLLQLLLRSEDYSEVLSISRKKNKVSDAKFKQLVINLDELEKHSADITGDVVFCCLGTTKEQTPDQLEYRKIDHDYPVALAKIALKNGANQYHFISSIGANEKASGFYLKTKGETEADLKKVGLRSLYIYQPSLLIGERQHARTIERISTVIMNIINPLLLGVLKKYRSIKASTVAAAMFKQSIKNETGVFTYTSDKIQQLS